MSFKGEGPFWRWLLQCDTIDDVLFHIAGRAAMFSNVLPSDPPSRQIHNTRRILLRIKWLLDTQRLAYNLSGRSQLRLKMVMLLRIILHILDFGSSEHPSAKVDSEYTVYRRVTLETLLSALRLLMLYKTPMTLDEEDLIQSRLNHMLVIWKNVQGLSIVEDSLLAQLVPELLASRNRMSTIVKEDASEAVRERSNSSLTSFLMTSFYLPKVLNGSVIEDTKSNLSLVETSTCFWKAYDVVSDTVTSIMVDSEDPRNEITPEASSLLQILSDSIESSEASPRHLFLFETLFVGIGAVRSLRTPEALQNHPLLDRVKRITRYEVLEFREIFDRPDYQSSQRSSDTNWSPKSHKPTPTQSTMASTPDIESSATSHAGDLQNGNVAETEASVQEPEVEPQLDDRKAPEPVLPYPTQDGIKPRPAMPMSPPLSETDLTAEQLSTEEISVALDPLHMAETPLEEIQQDNLMVPGQEYQGLGSLTPSSFGDPANPRLSTVSTVGTFEEAQPLVMEARRAVVVRMVGSQCQSPISQHSSQHSFTPVLTRVGGSKNDESASSVASVSEYSASAQSPSFNPVATYSKFLQNFPEPESRKVVTRSKSVAFENAKSGRPRTISISNPISRPRDDSGSIFGSDSDKSSITRHKTTTDRTRNAEPSGYERDLTGENFLNYSPPPPFSERSSERSNGARASHDEKTAWQDEKEFAKPITTPMQAGFTSPTSSVLTMPSTISESLSPEHLTESDVSITALLARLRSKERDHNIPIESGLEVVTDQMAPPQTPKHGRLYSDEQLQNRMALARPITAVDSDTWSVRKSIAGESSIDKRKRGLFGRLRTSGKDSISKISTKLPQGLEFCFSSCGKRAILWSRKDSAQIVVLSYPFTQGQVFRLGQLAPWISDEAYVLGLNIRFLVASSDRIAAVVHLDQVRRLYLLMPDGEQQFISLEDEIPLIQTIAISPDGTFVALGCGNLVLVYRILDGNFEKAKEINLKSKTAAQSIRYQRVGFSVDSKKLVCASQVSQSVQRHAVITGIWECSGSEIREYGWIEPVPIPVGYGDDSGITSCFYVPKGADRVPGQVFLSAAVSKQYPSILFLNKKHKFRPLEITDRKIECASQCTVGGFDSAHAIAVRSGRHKIFLIDARNGRAAPVLDLSQQRKNIGLKTEVMALGVPDESCVLVMWRDGNEALKLTKVLVDGRTPPETVDVGEIYRQVAGC